MIDDSHASVTSNITKIQLRRDVRVVLNNFANYETCFGNSFHIKNINGYNIKSSGFTVSGISDTVYISDRPSDEYTGTLFLFTNKDAPLVIRNNVGTIDYSTGEIKISSINILSTIKNNIIEISVIPKSNDVIGLQDLYLQMDLNYSTINMVSDDISSGGDISGSSYITSSSYLNGNSTR